MKQATVILRGNSCQLVDSIIAQTGANEGQVTSALVDYIAMNHADEAAAFMKDKVVFYGKGYDIKRE